MFCLYFSSLKVTVLCCLLPGLENISQEIIKAGRHPRNIFKVQTETLSKFHCFGVGCKLVGAQIHFLKPSLVPAKQDMGRQVTKKMDAPQCMWESTGKERGELLESPQQCQLALQKGLSAPDIFYSYFGPPPLVISLQLSDWHLKWLNQFSMPVSKMSPSLTLPRYSYPELRISHKPTIWHSERYIAHLALNFPLWTIYIVHIDHFYFTPIKFDSDETLSRKVHVKGVSVSWTP